MKQNDELSIAFLKYLNKKDSDIKNINKVNMLLSVTEYVTRFEHEY